MFFLEKVRYLSLMEVSLIKKLYSYIDLAVMCAHLFMKSAYGTNLIGRIYKKELSISDH